MRVLGWRFPARSPPFFPPFPRGCLPLNLVLREGAVVDFGAPYLGNGCSQRVERGVCGFAPTPSRRRRKNFANRPDGSRVKNQKVKKTLGPVSQRPFEAQGRALRRRNRLALLFPTVPSVRGRNRPFESYGRFTRLAGCQVRTAWVGCQLTVTETPLWPRAKPTGKPRSSASEGVPAPFPPVRTAGGSARRFGRYGRPAGGRQWTKMLGVTTLSKKRVEHQAQHRSHSS